MSKIKSINQLNKIYSMEHTMSIYFKSNLETFLNIILGKQIT